jgi:hypothetical protein
MENKKIIQMEGILEQIVHRYHDDKFQNTFISIRQEHNQGQKGGTFYGFIPETILGEKINLDNEYNKNSHELKQKLRYWKNGFYIIETYKSNLAENEDFE